MFQKKLPECLRGGGGNAVLQTGDIHIGTPGAALQRQHDKTFRVEHALHRLCGQHHRTVAFDTLTDEVKDKIINADIGRQLMTNKKLIDAVAGAGFVGGKDQLLAGKVFDMQHGLGSQPMIL